LQGRNSLGDKRTVDSLICGDDRCAYSQAELTSHFWQKTNELGLESLEDIWIDLADPMKRNDLLSLKPGWLLIDASSLVGLLTSIHA